MKTPFISKIYNNAYKKFDFSIVMALPKPMQNSLSVLKKGIFKSGRASKRFSFGASGSQVHLTPARPAGL
jgi:hypothetical protein